MVAPTQRSEPTIERPNLGSAAHGKPRRRRSVAAVLALALLALGVGCAGYINYPPIGNDWAINNTNINPAHAIMEAGMLRALRRSGAPGDLQHGPYVVNPPQGTELRHAQALVDRLNAVPGFEGAQIVTPDNGHLPAYHITRLWVRGDEAIIDILRPVQILRPTEGRTEVHQPYTVWLRGGALEQWRTTASRDWPIGMETPPERWTWQTQFPQPPAEPGPLNQRAVSGERGPGQATPQSNRPRPYAPPHQQPDQPAPQLDTPPIDLPKEDPNA